MKAEYINPFVAASYSVLEMVLGHPPGRGTVSVRINSTIAAPCNVVCGVTGQVHGQVIYGMTEEVADKIAAAMLGMPTDGSEELATSAVAELGNMISGNAMQHLSEAGLVCDITPPSVLRGRDIRVSMTSGPAAVIPLMTQQGELTITIGLQ